MGMNEHAERVHRAPWWRWPLVGGIALCALGAFYLAFGDYRQALVMASVGLVGILVGLPWWLTVRRLWPWQSGT